MAELSAPYTREELVKDIVRALSVVEGREINLGNYVGNDVNREYISEITSIAINLVNQLSPKAS